MIQLNNISKRYGENEALKPFELTIESHKTTALIGPSGCGKSTLLRIIMGLIQPSTGSVTFEGTELNSQNILLHRRKMGYVIQDGGLFPHLTARQNVLLMAEEIQIPKEQREARLLELTELCRFNQSLLEQYPSQLSGGQRQRVSLMRGLMLDPKALLLDEPLGALDPMVRSALQSDLKEIFSRLRKTVVLVTHDMGEAGYLADHLVLMSEGKIEQQGTLSDLRERPSTPFVTEFLNAQRSLVML